MLWACLHFPSLPVDRQSQSRPPNPSRAQIPAAVIESQGPRRTIMACNAAAREAGIHAGLALKGAYALLPDLYVSDYDATEQEAHLEQLALWALQYSSWVTPRMPDCLLVEVGASLSLFGGLAALIDTLSADATAQGVTLHVGVAPTPSAATLFARVQRRTPVRDMAALREALAPIPIEYLAFDEFVFRGLRQSGIRTLGQLQAIPPASLTRRFGHACTELLYRLDGVLPDPCPAFTVPDTFHQAIDLPLEAPDTNSLAFPLNRLLGALGGYLRTHDQGVRQLTLRLYHHKHPVTCVTLTFLDPTADHRHLFRIATERLAQTILPSPVMRLAVNADGLAARERGGKDLFHNNQAQTQTQTQGVQQVIEALMARLGRHSLYTALPDDDHRPEKAWVSAMLETQQAPVGWPARPLWLLKTPRLAHEPLEITTAPERIENGWWDVADVRRDYFIARARSGSHYWVYCLRNDPNTLYIHGLFA